MIRRPAPTLFATDLEGVFFPEIWIAVAQKTGIQELTLTTRDVPDYDRLMRGRIQILRRNGISLADIQRVIGTVDPIPGAREFLDRVRARMPVIVLSDSFYEFTGPVLQKLGYPALFCNSLVVDEKDRIGDFRIRLKDGKREAVAALKSLAFTVIAVGDSYNDTTMLAAADLALLFRPSEAVKKDFPRFRTFTDYGDMKAFIERFRRGAGG